MHFLVLHNTKPVISKFARSLATFDQKAFSFKGVPRYTTDKGNTVYDIRSLLQQVDTIKYDGIIACIKGDALGSVWGIHNGVKIGSKKFSILQVEHHQGLYREYSGVFGMAELKATRKKTPYLQSEMTFDHELIHAICYQRGTPDLLHAMIKFKMYDNYKQIFTK